MKKIEMHCHSMGGSSCGTSTFEEIVSAYKEKGFDGVVLTNHYAQYISEWGGYAGKPDNEKVDFFFSLYDGFKAVCEKNGMMAFFGMEVRIVSTGTEYSLLGFDRQFFYDNPRLFELTQKELFDLCEENGVFMYQTHPFREGVQAGDPRYMHGAEYFNGHFHHQNNNDLAKKFVEENNLAKVVGTDYHHADQPIPTATLIPDDVTDNKSLAECIRSGKCQLVYDEDYYIRELKKYKGITD